jgi:hypothetical protein
MSVFVRARVCVGVCVCGWVIQIQNSQSVCVCLDYPHIKELMCLGYPITKTIYVCVNYPNKTINVCICRLSKYKTVNVCVGYPNTKVRRCV